jgi:hypothetical protein
METFVANMNHRINNLKNIIKFLKIFEIFWNFLEFLENCDILEKFGKFVDENWVERHLSQT